MRLETESTPGLPSSWSQLISIFLKPIVVGFVIHRSKNLKLFVMKSHELSICHHKKRSVTGHNTEEGENGSMPPLPPPCSLPEHRRFPFLLSWGTGCWLCWLLICKDGLGERGTGTGGPNHPVPVSQLGSCGSPARGPSLATACDLNWRHARVDINWNLTGLV